MRNENVVSAEDVNTLIYPAVNVLRGIELDLSNHPDCPYRDTARKAINNLMKLQDLANGEPCNG